MGRLERLSTKDFEKGRGKREDGFTNFDLRSFDEPSCFTQYILKPYKKVRQKFSLRNS